MLGFLICIAIAGLFAWFGYHDSVKTEGFKIVKMVLRPFLMWVGWKDELGRGIIFKQSPLVRIALAALIGVLLTFGYVLMYGFEGENALTAQPPWSVLIWVTSSVLLGFVFSYLWPGVRDGAVKYSEKAVEKVKEKLTTVEGVHGTYEHDSGKSEIKQKVKEPVKKEEPLVEVKKEEPKPDPREEINKYLKGN